MRWLIVLCVVVRLGAQDTIVNPDFEEAGPNGMPLGWSVPSASAHFKVRQVFEGCRHGKACVEMAPGASTGFRFGTIEQSFPVVGFSGMQVLFSAFLRPDKGAQGALQVKAVDAAGNVLNTSSNVLQSTEGVGNWRMSYLPVVVPRGTANLELAVLAFAGRVLVDSISIPSYRVTAMGNGGEGPSPLNRTALNNLVGFARLFGVIRYFDPSDQAANADWYAIATEGVRTLDYAIEAPSLGRRIQNLFEKASPAVKVYVGPSPAIEADLRPEGKQQLLRWRYESPGIGKRVTEPASTWTESDLRTVDLGRELSARVPVAVFLSEGSTIPRPKRLIAAARPTTIQSYSGNDRASRIMIVILAWNFFKHFRSAEELQRVDWDDALVRAMHRAAVDKDGEQFIATLNEMVSKLGAWVAYKSGPDLRGIEFPGEYRVIW